MTDCKTCGGTGEYRVSAGGGAIVMPRVICPDCKPTTDIDTAIEAVARAVGGYTLGEWDAKGAEAELREHIMPVVDELRAEGEKWDKEAMASIEHLNTELAELKAENARLDEALESSDMLLQGARHFGHELKALASKYIGEKDYERRAGYGCRHCGEECMSEYNPKTEKGWGPGRCQNPECVAFRLREMSKE